MITVEKVALTNHRPRLTRPSYAALVLMFLTTFRAVSGDVDSILEQIKQEKSSAQTQQRTPTVQVPAAVSTTTSPTRNEATPPPMTTPARQVQTKPARLIPSQIWSPKDKLPKNVEGHGVAGKFAIEGQYEGRLCLVPLQDKANPFARHFVVVNRSLNLPEYHVLPIPEREVVEIPRDAPLIIERKGIMGYYYVRVQD
jgi:hypothetical protein